MTNQHEAEAAAKKSAEDYYIVDTPFIGELGNLQRRLRNNAYAHAFLEGVKWEQAATKANDSAVEEKM